MNWKNRLTNYNFWISMFSAVLLILQALKIKFDIAYVNEIFTAVLGLLVVIGIISDPTRTSVKQDSTQTKDIKQEKISEEIPTVKKNEIDNGNLKDNLQTILTTISEDLKEKMQELKDLSFKSSKEEKPEANEETHKEKEISLPAVAETDNPYINIIE